MSLGSLSKVLGSFGSSCCTGLLLFPELLLLFEVFELVLFLLEIDTPTPTPIPMSARRPTRAPMICGNRMDQPIWPLSEFRTRRDPWQRAKAPPQQPIHHLATKEGRTKNFDLRLLDCCFSNQAEEECAPLSLRWE